MPSLAHLDGFFPKEVSVRLGRRVQTSVRGGLHFLGSPRAVRVEGWCAEAPEEVKVGCRGVGDLADVGIQCRTAGRLSTR